MARGRLRWSRVFIAMFGLSLSIFAVDGLRRGFYKTTNDITVNGDFVEKNPTEIHGNTDTTTKDGYEDGTQPKTVFEGIQNLGYSELSVPPSKFTSGALAIINDEHPADRSASSGTIGLLKNMKSDDYSLINESVKLNENAAAALNSMMSAYHEATGLTDFVVYGTNETFTGEGSLCPMYFPESVVGNTIDLVVNAYGTLVTYDGNDAQGWIVDNCYKYGYIVRYPRGKENNTGNSYCPWHLRYVGQPHSVLMQEKGLCLEEYVDFLKNYSYDNALIYSFNDVEYEIYTSEAVSETASARVPVSGNYSVSGDNIGTYIITVEKN